MVRFREIIRPDGREVRKTAEPGKPDHMIAQQVAPEEKTDGRRGAPVRGRELQAYYRQLIENTVEIQGRILKGEEVNPSPVMAVFRHIIDHDLVDDLFTHAVSMSESCGRASGIVSGVLAYLKLGKDSGCPREKLLKRGFAGLIQFLDTADFPDALLEDHHALSPDDIAAIRKHPAPALDILAGLFINSLHVFRSTAGNHDQESGPECPPIIHHENEDGMDKATETEQEATVKMKEPGNVYKELAEIAAEKKSASLKWVPVLIILAVIVVAGLWLGGILSFDRGQKPNPASIKKHGPVFQKKRISQAIKMPEPVRPSVPREEKNSVGKSSLPVNAVRYPYSLHMGSFRTLDLTQKSIAGLRKKGVSPYWTRVDLGKKGKWYRVFVGYFRTPESADRFQKKHAIKADRVLKTAYGIMVGVYRSKVEMNKKISALQEAGYCPYTIVQPGDQYLLMIGAYQTRKAAEQLAAELRKSGLDCRMIMR
ncbi:MAG: hypothetical protein DRH37_05135 [Deltaproteobacteria bacterium]|nr:MAG: hypothetical protein DRH37_05135 [Deltaproteobacteria bacterium]